MLTVNINGKKPSLWGTLAQMAIAGVASYGMAKAANHNESLTVNINGKKASLWETLAQMAIAGVASYGMAKAANHNESWTGYRDAMLNNMAQVAIPFAIQYVPGMKEQADANPNIEVQQ